MALNRDLGPPTGEPDKLPVSFDEIYSGILKTYWVKKQILNEDLTYSFEKRMPLYSTLHIPKVVRFIHTYSDDKDIAADHCSDRTGDSECISKSWVSQSQEHDGAFPGDPQALRWPVDALAPFIDAYGRVISEFASTSVGSIGHQYSVGLEYGIRSDGLPIGSMPIPDTSGGPGDNGISVTYYFAFKTAFVLQCIETGGGGDGGGGS